MFTVPGWLYLPSNGISSILRYTTYTSDHAGKACDLPAWVNTGD
jgi:hypothetical protein